MRHVNTIGHISDNIKPQTVCQSSSEFYVNQFFILAIYIDKQKLGLCIKEESERKLNAAIAYYNIVKILISDILYNID
jgi:hypothetical protein